MSKSAAYLREREQEQIDAATKAALRRPDVTPAPAPTPAAAPVIVYDIKHRFVQALADCHGDAYQIPYKLIEEAKAKLGDKEIDSETYHLARGIDDVIISVNASYDKVCRELRMVHCTKRLAELKAEAKIAAEKQIADAAIAKAHSGRFVKRTP